MNGSVPRHVLQDGPEIQKDLIEPIRAADERPKARPGFEPGRARGGTRTGPVATGTRRPGARSAPRRLERDSAPATAGVLTAAGFVWPPGVRWSAWPRP